MRGLTILGKIQSTQLVPIEDTINDHPQKVTLKKREKKQKYISHWHTNGIMVPLSDITHKLEILAAQGFLNEMTSTCCFHDECT